MIRSSVSTAIGDPPIGAEGTLIIDWHVGLELRNRMELKAIDKVVLCFAIPFQNCQGETWIDKVMFFSQKLQDRL